MCFTAEDAAAGLCDDAESFFGSGAAAEEGMFLDDCKLFVERHEFLAQRATDPDDAKCKLSVYI